ncbi:MAG: hypothetical protein C0597_15845 [Marinilabiliales bacterium]|nr:MAG: hypothetical protein C0597_15845 [Marinilabiliales bacterium]
MTKYRLLFILVLSLLLTNTLFAQIDGNLNPTEDILNKVQKPENGQVVIFQDMRINDLLYNHVEQNKRKGGVSGYRIRIYSDLGSGARDQSQAARTRFYERFPEIPIYREYDSPYFKVYVGDYRTRVDALKDFNQIKRSFHSAFIVPSKINYPEIE